jgi:hypothetical protein
MKQPGGCPGYRVGEHHGDHEPRVIRAAEQRAHVKSGLIKVEPQWGRPSSGRVTVKVF